jgi:hypothetical protein
MKDEQELRVEDQELITKNYNEKNKIDKNVN